MVHDFTIPCLGPLGVSELTDVPITSVQFVAPWPAGQDNPFIPPTDCIVICRLVR